MKLTIYQICGKTKKGNYFKYNNLTKNSHWNKVTKKPEKCFYCFQQSYFDGNTGIFLAKTHVDTG